MTSSLIRTILRGLAALPVEVLAAIIRVIVVLILAVVLLLRWLFRLLAGKEDKPRHDPGCCKIPEHVKRKPEPCLYSQFYRRSQGLSVTWDNPDIWITLPDGALQDSSNLAADKDYVVHARIHNASFDAALGTAVRCLYRPFSFNSPDRTPIETNPDGTEKVVFLHIGAWSSEVAQFKWRTPATAAHYCLQVECFHPDDINPNNNLGQENTNVRAPRSGEAGATAALKNRSKERRRFKIEVDAYRIKEGKFTVSLKTRTLPLRKKRPADWLHNLLMTRDPVKGGIKTQTGRAPTWTRYAYTGWEQLKKDNEHGKFPLPAGWGARVDGAEPGFVTLEPGEQREIALSVTVPPDAPAARQPINFTAIDETGKVAGGVTIYVDTTGA